MKAASESRLMTQARVEEVFATLERAARAQGICGVEATIGAGSHALTRFANNIIHQNVADRSQFASVRVLIDGRTARASTNRLDEASLARVVEEAAAAARAQGADSSLLPLAEPGQAATMHRAFQHTAALTPDARASAVAGAIAAVERENLTAAGIYSSGESVLAMVNTRGLFVYHTETMAHFSVTAMGTDSSGWAKGSACDHEDLDPVRLAKSAASKAAASRAPGQEPPGRYTVILEPAAVLDLVGQMFGDFSATAIRDGRSFLTGRARMDLFGPNIHITDDVFHPLQAGAPFDGEGVPRRRLTLVEDGVVREVAFSRQAAHIAAVEPTGHGFPVPNEAGEAPVNIVIAGGGTSLEQMIATTPRGILVTRFWYIREVDPYEKIMTGMTRDGTFLIENGAVVRGLRNFRFNQGLLEMLRNVEALGPAARASGEEAIDMVVPPMKVRDFHFTEVTRF